MEKLLICTSVFIIARSVSGLTLNLSGPLYSYINQTYLFNCTISEGHDVAFYLINEKLISSNWGIQPSNGQCFNFRTGLVCNNTCGCDIGKWYSWIMSVNESFHGSTWTCQSHTEPKVKSNELTLNVTVPFTAVYLSTNNKTTYVNNGSVVALVCTTFPSSRPPATVTWYRKELNDTCMVVQGGHTPESGNGAPVSTSSTLNYSVSVEDHGKQIYCEATATDIGLTKSSNETQLYVRYAPSGPIKLNIQPNLPGYIDSSTVNLTCLLFGGHPPAELSWSCNNKQVSSRQQNTSQISVTVNSSYDGKSCICAASHPFRSYPAQQKTFVVYYAPTGLLSLSSNPQGSPANSHNTGTTVTLTCSVNGGNPVAALRWTCKGSDVTQGLVNQSTTTKAKSKLTFTMYPTYNGQQCICKATHQYIPSFGDRVAITFTVYFVPPGNLHLELTEQPLYEGDQLNVVCSISGGNPLPHLTLQCSNSSGTDISNSTTSIMKLAVQNITSISNNKTCLCTATHQRITSYRKEETTSLIVFYPPSNPVINPSSKFPWRERQTRNLTCKATDGYPSATAYLWKKNGDIVTEGATILFHYLNYTNDKETYMCYVTNNFTTHKKVEVSKSISLNVQYRPILSVSLKTIKLREGDDLRTTCNATGNPIPTVKWFRENHLTGMSSSPGQPAVLQILNLNRSHGGTYICKGVGIANDLTSNTTIDVFIFYPPDTLPLISGYDNDTTIHEGDGDINITCSISDGNPLPMLQFECVNFNTTGSTASTTEAQTMIYRILTIDRTLQVCECKASSPIPELKYNIMTSVQFNVKYLRLQAEEDVYDCENARSVTMRCKTINARTGIRFLPWEHKIGNETIRYLNGIQVGLNYTKLSLNVCGYQDYGSYTCSAEYMKFTSSYTASLHVLSKPVLSGEATIKEYQNSQKIEFSVEFFSSPEPDDIEWYRNGKPVFLSEKYQQLLQPTSIQLTMHTKKVTVSGYKALLVITNKDASDYGDFEVHIINAKGRAEMEIKYRESTNDTQTTKYGIILGGIFAGLFVLCCMAFMLYCFYQKSRKRSSKDSSSRSKDSKQNSYEDIQLSRVSRTSYSGPYEELQVYETPPSW